MNLSTSRQFIVQSVLALGLCVGVWMITVRPKIDELIALERTIAEAPGLSGPFSSQTIEQAAKRMNVIRDQVGQISARNRLADDTSRLYGLVMDLADSSGVQVQALQPGGTRTSMAANAPLSATRLDMTVEGPYENVAKFLDSVISLDAFIRADSLQLAPTKTNGKSLVSATFDCNVMSFKIDEALTNPGGIAHAAP
jgi:Tfp pilus assembly protein PilO